MTELTPLPLATGSTGAAPAMIPPADPIRDLPILILYPHSRCNCRCVMCDIWRAKDRTEITASDVRSWVDEWRGLGVRRLVLSGGEPLMHSHLWELCEAVRGAGIGITILSTGLLLGRHAADVVRYCDDVVVSLDGPGDVHDAIRNIPGAFGKLAAGAGAVKAADAGVRVSGRCTVQRQNFRHLRATVAAAHEAGLDGISFLAVDVSSAAFNRPDGWPASRVEQVVPTAAELPALRDELRALYRERASDFEDGFIAESPEKLDRRVYRYFAALHGAGDFAPVRCNAPWVSSVVETDGTVRPCFFQPPLGNIHEAGNLEGVLNSDAALAWRRGLDTRRDEICRRCVCSLALRGDGTAAGDGGADG